MKKTLFLSAILATALCSSALADSATTAYTEKDGVTYNGGIYTLSGTGNFSARTFTADMNSTDGSIAANSTTGWTSFASGSNRVYGHTLHLTSISADTSVTTDFDPFTVGGLIVDAGTGTWTVGRSAGNGTLTQIWGNGDAHMLINGSATLLGGKGVEVKSSGTWDIAEGKTLTLSTGGNANAVSFGADTTVTLSGNGTLALSGATLSFGTGAKLIVGENNTLALATGSDWTKVGEETKRTSGNGFGTQSYTRDFGTSIENHGTITVDGNAATMSEGVVTGTGNSATYYINDASAAWNEGSASAVQVNVGSDTLALAAGKSLNVETFHIQSGRVETQRNNATGVVTGEIIVDGGATLAVTGAGQDAFGYSGNWGGNYTDAISLNGTDANHKATLELSQTSANSVTMSTNLNLNGYSQVTGTRAFNTYDGAITATGTDNVIGVGVQLRKALSVVVNDESTLDITGNIASSGENNVAYSLTKTGNGVLTISGDITGTAAHIAIINGDGANTIVKSAAISNATLNDVALAKGTHTFTNASLAMTTATDMTQESLTLDNSTITLGTDTFGTLTTSALTVNSNSTINANLATAEGAELTFTDGVVTLNGTLTLGSGTTVSLGTAYLETLSTAGQVLLFTGVTNQIDSSILESIVVTGAFLPGHLLSVANGSGTYDIYATPEPATATLSLLALAGLMARRRRH